MQLKPQTAAFWQEYVSSRPAPEKAGCRLYDVFHIGDSEQSADEGASLIRNGVKTATSSLLWEYEITHKPLPQVGALSIVEDGSGAPVCVVETIWLAIQKFSEVDAQFAYAYGEWDRTLEGWREHCWAYYAEQCRGMGKPATSEMLLVCERLRVLYP